ncbi:serine carboxypeptidase-like 44 isoform X1 [Durio zibethinus]|uniref:Serine carboxypeptidase-like 44 isoform X1 n=1 Tax=Durio zibethinus TaxID=66656 RepID=A0A6P5WPQ8_DURZI|nr:serine carboxypeptidase-like 44 isoform X1 [Durio zibethinus]
MDIGGFFLRLFFFIFGGIFGYPMDEQIGKLPGQPHVNFRQFSGYIDVDGKAGRSLFYYLVEAENDPMNLPLTVWLTGGPGCSSVGDSFISVGPFTTSNNAHCLQRNPHSWIKVSNILFIDSPIGVGWSYSKTSSDYQVGDDSTNEDLLAFILQWFDKYPNFKSRDLYLAGSSYAGHFIPNLGNTLLDYNKQSNDLKFNIKGLALGNPLLRSKLDILALYELFWSRGMINKDLHQQILKECDGIDEDNYSNNATNWSESCQQAMDKAELIAFNVTSIPEAKARHFDILRSTCDGKWEDLNLEKEVIKITYEVDMCLPFRAEFYLNIPEVQKAFHGNRTNLEYQWRGCFENSGLNYSAADRAIDMLPALKQILQHSIPVTIFSGEEDGVVPTIGTLKHVKKLAKDMNLNLTKDEAWNHENKDGGWKYSYENLLTFMTVKGANHHVTLSKPSQALFIFTNIVLNRTR